MKDKPAQTEINQIKEMYEVGTPFEKGCISYYYGEKFKPHIPLDNPYKKGTKKYIDWIRGANKAALLAQDDEE